jgi:hypothetical protein
MAFLKKLAMQTEDDERKQKKISELLDSGYSQYALASFIVNGDFPTHSPQ